MKVKVGSSVSEAKEYGVTQSSVLGLLLFSIYINDLPRVDVWCIMIMYADDVVLYRSGKSRKEVE